MSERTGKLTNRSGEAVALAVVAFMFALPLRGLLRAPGPPMEEGFMLVFPELVLHGEIPNRDFLHLYGPGSLWALAAAFKVFGYSLLTERLFGLAQQMAIVFGVYALTRRWGRTIAVSGAVTSALIIIPFGLTALAWVGGVGLGVLGLAAGLHAAAPTAAQTATETAIAGRDGGRSRPVCCSASRCCSDSTSSSRSACRSSRSSPA